jgi:alkyldihydroxyacetonephosphate synthase
LDVCRWGRLESLLEASGLDYEIIEGPLPGSGGEWWGYPFDAWPLANLALHLRGVRTRILVVTPRNAGEVAETVNIARRSGSCIVARGGGSGVLGASWPRGCCIVLDLRRLSWVEPHYDDGYVYVGAGTILWDLEKRLAADGFTTGLEPQSVRLASIGGLLSTLGAGALQPGIGNIEDAVLFVDLVDGTGRRLRLGSPRRPRSQAVGGGPSLVLGGEGTLGIVVGAGLRVRRKPAFRATATMAFEGFGDAVEAARRLVQWNQPAILRIIDEYEASSLYGSEGTLLLLAYYDDEDSRVPEALAGKALRIAASLGGRPTRDIFDEWYNKRYDYGALVAQVTSLGLWFDTIDLQATWAKLPRLHAGILGSLTRLQGVVGAFAHSSHFNVSGGSLYVTVVVEKDPLVLARAWQTAMEEALKLGASVTHHHGIGLQKLYWAVKEDREMVEVYCRIKRAMDPGFILSPHGLPSLCSRGHGQHGAR